MNWRRWTVFVLIATNVLTLLWVAMPTIRNAVPIGIVVDALVAQLIITCAVSGSWLKTG
jgi:hypothetical protein